MTEWLDEQTILYEIALDYRIKSYASIVGKYERYLNSSRHVSQVFNDVPGFRAFYDSYASVPGGAPGHYRHGAAGLPGGARGL